MNLTALWFVINIFFVASFIVTLFMHRAVASATATSDTSRKKKLKTIRNSFIAATAILFVAMSAAFISNMYING